MICSRVLLRRDVILMHRTPYGLLEFPAQPVFSSQGTYCTYGTGRMTPLSACIVRGGVRLLISGQVDPTTLSTLVAAGLLEQYQLDLWVLPSCAPPAALRAGSRWGSRRRRSGRWSRGKREQCAGSQTWLQPGRPGFSECPGLPKPGSRRLGRSLAS